MVEPSNPKVEKPPWGTPPGARMEQLAAGIHGPLMLVLITTLAVLAGSALAAASSVMYREPGAGAPRRSGNP